jgi:hypothetical protein
MTQGLEDEHCLPLDGHEIEKGQDSRDEGEDGWDEYNLQVVRKVCQDEHNGWELDREDGHALQVAEHYSKDEQDSRVEGENCEDEHMNMSFRLTDMRVRMDKTRGLRKRTVRMDI